MIQELDPWVKDVEGARKCMAFLRDKEGRCASVPWPTNKSPQKPAQKHIEIGYLILAGAESIRPKKNQTEPFEGFIKKKDWRVVGCVSRFCHA